MGVTVALYRSHPVVTLVPGAIGHHVTGQHGQAWCVCWRPDHGHCQLATGFSDGKLTVFYVVLTW